MLRWAGLALLLAQFPFVYRVCQTWQVDRYLASGEQPGILSPPLPTFRGGLHIHSAAGSHSLGTYPEILAAAKQAGYRWLLMTEHPKPYSMFQPLEDAEVVMIYGWELEREDGTRELVDPDRRVRIWSEYPVGPPPEDVTGIEVFNLADSASTRNHLFGWMTWLHHQYSFPLRFGLHAWEIDPERIRIWDEANRVRPLPGFAGSDAHQNLGLMLVTGTGKRLLSVFVDPYLHSFSFATNHIQLPLGAELTRDTVLEALVRGASFVCFELAGNPEGFSFHAEYGERVYPIGSEVQTGARLVFQSPHPVRFRLMRDGREEVVLEGRRFSHDAEPGVYRLEAYRLDPPALLAGKPWIITNPIFVR